MDLLIRTLLIWLLMLAIPAQGVAAATMAFCGPKHHGGAAGIAEHMAPSHHAHGDREATAAHEHPRVDADAPTADHFSGSAKAKDHLTDQHKCNVCGACCSTGALMSALPTLPATDAASTAFSSLEACIDPFAADGPDRPPRNLPV